MTWPEVAGLAVIVLGQVLLFLVLSNRVDRG